MYKWTILSHLTFIFFEVSAMREMPIITLPIVATISLQLKHRGRSSFPDGFFPVSLEYCRSAELSLSARLLDSIPFAFSFLRQGHGRMNMFRLSSTSLLTSKIDNHCLFLQLL